MIAEVIAIGDELTTGQRLDTNSQWLSQQLVEDCGVNVLWHTTVGDDLLACTEVFRTATRRADIVVVTGGLGPTADDLTRQALADAAGVALYLDDSALLAIEKLFKNRGYTMPESNRVQAMFPIGSTAIHNPKGTAPGVSFKIKLADSTEDSNPNQQDCHLFAMPGVPAEMFEMWANHVAPEIKKRHQSNQVIRHHRITCFGAGESRVEEMLGDLLQRGREPRVGITVSQATITLRITAMAETEQAALELIEPTVKLIHDRLGNLVYGEEEDELQHAIARLMIDQEKTLSLIEWGTRGMVTERLNGLVDSHKWLRAGHVVSSLKDVETILNSSKENNNESQFSSTKFKEQEKQLTREIAKCCREMHQTDIGIAISEIPENAITGESDTKYYIAYATEDEVKVYTQTTSGHPSFTKIRCTKRSLNTLRLKLLNVDI